MDENVTAYLALKAASFLTGNAVCREKGDTHRVSGASRLLGTFCQLVENELRNRRKAARKAGEGNVSFSPTMDEQVKGRGL